MADPNSNPFAGLITSESLKQKRFGEVMGMAGDNPNAQIMQRAVFNFTEQLRANGHGLTPEDIKARRNDGILQMASKRMGERVEQGQMDPQDALAETLEDAFQEFLTAGDAESAAVIAPHIFAQRAKQAELSKLKAETAWTGARPDVEAAKLEVATAKAETAAERARTQQILDLARANLADRTDPNLRGSGGAGGAKTTSNGFTKFRSQGGSVVGLLSSLGDLHRIYIERPGVASQPATLISSVADSVKGAKELVSPEHKAYNYDQVQAYTKGNSRQIEGLAKSLNVDRGLLESTVIDTAYTLARARDPGGRISNADFDNAIKLLGAAKDPNRAKAVILDLARRTSRDFRAQAAANPDFADEPVISQVEDAYEALLGQASGKGPANIERPSTAAPKAIADMTDEELQALANGG